MFIWRVIRWNCLSKVRCILLPHILKITISTVNQKQRGDHNWQIRRVCTIHTGEIMHCKPYYKNAMPQIIMYSCADFQLMATCGEFVSMYIYMNTYVNSFIHKKVCESTSRRHLMSPGHYPLDLFTSLWSPKGHSHGHEWLTPIPFFQYQSALSFLRYGYFKIWRCKSMAKAMHVVEEKDHIVGSAANQFMFFSFHSNVPCHSFNTAFSKFDLQNSRLMSWQISKLMATFET